jgi:hypothetical protein
MDVMNSILDRHMTSQGDLASSPSTRSAALPVSTPSGGHEQYATLTELKPVNTPVLSGGYSTRDIAYVPVTPYDGKSQRKT